VRRIAPATLKAWLGDGRELAILDARETGEFAAGHLFWAVPCPLSQAELRVPELLPTLATRLVSVDGGGGHAERLAAHLAGLGATDLAVLEGGTPGWAAAGFETFTGVNVPSKAFGEWVEHHYGTPSIDAAELAARQARGDNLIILDSRPLEEFRAMSIPGGIDVPGGELAYRVATLVPDPATTIVVNCAGRTRSILGAESLRRAGVPNPVVALRNGTMGWELAGFACAHGETASYPPGTPADARASRARAERFATAAGVRTIDAAGLAALRAEPGRTTYLLDVRAPAEFAAGHLPGSRNAPGGQLVQATDRWVAVRGARLVLIDDTGTRAYMAAAWLRQLGGWETCVLDGGLAGRLGTGPAPLPCPAAEAIGAATCTPAQLAAASAVTIIDLARSLEFRSGHIPGALWGVRTRLAALAPLLPRAAAAEIVVTAPDRHLARLAVPELQALAPAARVAVLEGGTAAWQPAGHPLAADRLNPPDDACIDTWLRPYDRNHGQQAAMRAYLAWEIDLVRQIERDGDARFGRW
jgi:rhodanese-related sulfurtransferase